MRQETTSRTNVAVTCIGLFLTSLFLTAYSARHPSLARVGTSLVSSVTGPFNSLIDATWNNVEGLWSGYVNLYGAARENQSLKSKLQELHGRESLMSELERENNRLRELLKFSSERNLSGVTASVIGADPSGWVKGITVNRGSSDGIASGMAVIHPQGVVGQVVAVSSKTARVLLVSDHASGVDVVTQDSRARGIVEGGGERICELKFIPKDARLMEGEAVLTSGMDGVYPKGLLVGTVERIGSASVSLFKTVELRPAVDLSRIEEVLIVSVAPASRAFGAEEKSKGE
jgi:rod shape-determining protein MreC